MKKMNLFTKLLLFLPQLLLCSLPLSSPASPSNKTSDAQNLLSFKSSLPAPEILHDWNQNGDPCSFTGVSCNNNSRVTSLNLSSLSLSSDFSSVSTHLFSIEQLTFLALKSSNITGPLRPFSFCSPSLAEIDLSENSISGSFADLSKFESCLGLMHLNLSSNLLDNSKELKGYRFGLLIETLDVSSNHLLSGEDILPWVLSGGCSHLGHLSVKANKLVGSFSLSGCSRLEHLDLSSNNFSIPIPNLGRDCPNLKHIDLSSNRFSGEVGDAMAGLKSLSYLNVSNNLLTGGFPSLPSLEFLYLGNNQFEGMIPESFADQACSTLMELDLSFNNFSGMIPSAFGSCSLLETFDISSNNFSGNLPMDIFMKMSNLKKLGLAFNKFEGTLPEYVSSSLSSLETLDLSSNNIYGKIPPGICAESNLKELSLANNVLTGFIPPTLGNCSELVSLDLSFNFLSGRIPGSLGQLSKLKDLIMWMNQLEGEIPQELMYNQELENLILDYNKLTGTIPSGLRNCTNLNWISLSSNSLSGKIPSWIGSLANLAILKLSNNSFHGEIPSELGECKSLLWLDLNSNFLTGSIPSALAKQSGYMAVGLVVGKKYVYLRNDGSKDCQGTGNLLEFAGIRQEALDRIPRRKNTCNFTRIYRGNTQPTFNHNGSMIFLDLSFNSLEGSIPKELGSMSYLSILNLGHNNLSGSIPPQLGGLKYIGVLDLSHNHLSSQIPSSLAGLTLLTEIDLSYNELSGVIPETGQFETFPASRFYNNAGLCGYPLPNCDNSSGLNASEHQRHRRQASFAGSVAMGLLFSLFCIFGAIIVAAEVKKRRNRKKETSSSSLEMYMEGNSQSGWRFRSNNRSEVLSINLATFENPLRRLTLGDLVEATNGFAEESMIGKGGFGDVYKAELKDGSVVAIKKLIHISGQGDREFTAEMETIGKIKHRNLVPLLGYCKVGEERLLVYEYMKYGSLDDVLHNHKKGGMKLNWGARRKIAIGAARGLAFLHHNCIPHIIHRDMKSSNVLIDQNLEARVSDFGMARLMSAMDTHLSVSTLAGTPGYVPPEYYQSFRCSTKGDVYSYGVVLLELLTGKQPTDSPDFGENNNLVSWVKQMSKLRVLDVFDQELVKEDPGLVVELLHHLKLACACLDDRPWKRPTMIQVMAMFKEIQAQTGFDHDDDDPSFTAMGKSFSTVDVLDMSLTQIPEGNHRH